MDAKNNKSTEALKISGDWSQQADELKEKYTKEILPKLQEMIREKTKDGTKSIWDFLRCR